MQTKRGWCWGLSAHLENDSPSRLRCSSLLGAGKEKSLEGCLGRAVAVLQLPAANSSSGGQVLLSAPRKGWEDARGCPVPQGYSEGRGCFVLTQVFPARSCFPGCLSTSASADLPDTAGVELAWPSQRLREAVPLCQRPLEGHRASTTGSLG